MVLIGDKLPYVTAILTIIPAAGPKRSLVWIRWKGNRSPEISERRARRGREVQKKAVAGAFNQATRASFEQIRKFQNRDRDFTREHGELTPHG